MKLKFLYGVILITCMEEQGVIFRANESKNLTLSTNNNEGQIIQTIIVDLEENQTKTIQFE